MFCPALGIAEDPVSGNAHGLLGVYLAHHGFLPRNEQRVSFSGVQGHQLHRPGRVNVELEIKQRRHRGCLDHRPGHLDLRDRDRDLGRASELAIRARPVALARADTQGSMRARVSWAAGRSSICHTREGVFALDNICTHAHARMCEGRLRATRLVCPLHGASFDIRDGKVLGPPALLPLPHAPGTHRQRHDRGCSRECRDPRSGRWRAELKSLTDPAMPDNHAAGSATQAPARNGALGAERRIQRPGGKRPDHSRQAAARLIRPHDARRGRAPSDCFEASAEALGVNAPTPIPHKRQSQHGPEHLRRRRRRSSAR